MIVAGQPFATTTSGQIVIPLIAGTMLAILLGGARYAWRSWRQSEDQGRQLTEIKKQLTGVVAQHQNNGGSSTRDAIDRIEALAKSTDAKVDRVELKLDTDISRLNEHLIEAAKYQALFESDREQLKKR